MKLFSALAICLLGAGMLFAADKEFPSGSGKDVAIREKDSKISLSSSDSQLFAIPAESVLVGRLQAIGVSHFVEKTNITDMLAGRQLPVPYVCAQVEHQLDTYNKYLKNPQVAIGMQGLKNKIITTILGDSPAALAILEKQQIAFREKDSKISQSRPRSDSDSDDDYDSLGGITQSILIRK